MRAVVYRRISNDETGEAAGVTRQAADCLRYCKQRHWKVIADLEDNDISASRFTKKRRPGYQQMLELVETGAADAIVAWHLDRLWRRPAELEHLIDLAEHRNIIIATLNGEIDLRDGDGRFAARIQVNVAAKSSDDQSRRQRRKAEEDARAGRPHGPRAFGWQADRIHLDPVEAPIVVDMARRALAGEGLNTIAQSMNAQRIPNPQGGRYWVSQTVRVMLLNPRIAGLRSHHGSIVGAGQWEPILEREDWEKLVAALTDPSRITNRPGRRRLLTGLCFCGRCQEPLVYAHNGAPGRGQGNVGCQSPPRGCGRLSVATGPLEQAVVEAVWYRVDRSTAVPARRGPDTSQLATIEGRQTELATMWAAGEMSRREWLAARSHLETRAQRLRRELATEARSARVFEWAGKPGVLAEHWESLGLDRQRQVLAGVLDRVTVAPSKLRGCRFDDSRVKIRWR